MRYRVIRDLGNTDLPVGSLFDGEALDARRVQRLVEQGRIAPVVEPNEQVAALEAEVAALTAENARLEAALAEAQAGEGENRDDGEDQDPQDEGDAPDPPSVESAEDLEQHTVPALKEIAALRGITGVSSMTKPELIAALLAGPMAPPEPSEA